MSAIHKWSETYTTSATTRVFTIPVNVAVGRLIALSFGRGGAGTINAITALGTNTWNILAAGPHTNNTFNGALVLMRVTQAITAGATFTVTASATSNRWNMAGAIFDDLIVANYATRVQTSAISSSTPVVNAGPTPSLTVPRALVITAVAMTSNGSPIGHQSNKVAAQVVTAAGSADRGCALLFKYEGGVTHTGSFTVSNSSTSWSATVALECEDLPAGTIPYMTDEGEVPGVLWVVKAGVEKPVIRLDIAGVPEPPGEPKKLVGMSAPQGLWTTRLAQVGPASITCRRIFANMTSNGRDQEGLIEDALEANMLPVLSYKEPAPGGTPDVNGVINGTYDTWITNTRNFLDSYDTEIISIFHHEARGDMTQGQFLSASRRWLDRMQTANVKVSPINMGFLLDSAKGRTEFNTWSDDTLLADWDYFGIDTYQSGTFDAPGPTIPSDRIPYLLDWLDSRGFPNKPVIIGEYNGWTADALAETGEVFLSTPNIKLFMVFNSDGGSKGEPLVGDRLNAFKTTKADSRVLQIYTP